MASLIVRDPQGSCFSLCEIYGDKERTMETSVISFNLFTGKEKYIGYNYVAKLGKF